MNSERARAIGVIGGQRSAQARKRLVLTDVEEQLGALDDAADVRRWARQVILWSCSGKIPGAVANACASLLREWGQAHRVEKVEGRLRALEDELAAARKRP